MKFEKLNENKIRITLNTQDLAEKNIDFHSFMSNSKESQVLFLDMLNEAEKKVGFITKDYKLRIEALAMSDGNFILTITRFGKELSATSNQSQNKKVKIQRKKLDLTSNQFIYNFKSFNDFCNFCNFIQQIPKYTSIAKNIILYTYNNTYYLYISNINTKNTNIKQFCTLLTEFSQHINNSNLFIQKLNEYGKIIFKHNAIQNCLKYFNSNKKDISI